VTVPLGLAMGELRDLRNAQQEPRVFIGGMKQPRPDSPVDPGAIARGLAQLLEEKGIAVHLQAKWVERGIFLRHMAQSIVSVLLPVDDEGFFIPPLEAMAMGSAVAVPDAGGNRSFCLDGETCLMPPYTVEGLAEAALRLWSDPELRAKLRAGGFAMAERHTLQQERATFVAAMNSYLESAAFT
jgi:glycosyltransferase involved in cell wall biosynthesis